MGASPFFVRHLRDDMPRQTFGEVLAWASRDSATSASTST